MRRRYDKFEDSKKKREEIKRKDFLWHFFKMISKFRNRYEVVIDIGGGSGSNLLLLKEWIEFENAVLLDLKPRNNYNQLDLVIEGDAECLPFKDNIADLILLVEVLEHLIDPDRAIEEVKKCLKDDDVLALSTPNLASLWNRFLLLLGYQPIFTEVSSRRIFGRPGKQVVGHLRVFTMKALKEFLNFHEFEILTCKSTPASNIKNRFLNLVEKIAIRLRTGLGSRIIILAKKRG